ncbi:unnamed protein product [Mesocestoides corti]|uniref:UBC core domain-containing protein n=1 Tax=Mesocestoides corti TaxID=53468 RepID=A0A0R3U4X1_MESCO|nr:unnamed protein product [Mesocestoides corti]
MREAQELSQPTELYYAQPLEPNGRFEQYRQICLSISGYHPETWRPSWSIRTALLAIIGFMPTSGAGAIGSMNLPADERRKLAASSRNYVCEICGPTKDLVLPVTSASSCTAKEAQQVAAQFVLTDPDAPKESATRPQESNCQAGNTEPKENTAPQKFADGVPAQMNAFGGMPQPAYWLCYPVYLPTDASISSNTSGCSSTITKAGSGGRSKTAPLSFEDWLKKVRESATAPDDSRLNVSPGGARKSSSDKANLSTNQVQVSATSSPAPDDQRPARSQASSPTTIALDDALPVVTGEGGNTALVQESSVPVEMTKKLPPQPEPQHARESITQSPRVIPIPSQESTKEAAQRILKEAAERHRRRAAVMQDRFEGGTRLFSPSIPRQIQAAQLAAFTVAFLLIALLLRRLMLMSTAGV